ncbi:response regulator [Thermanaerothrix daxensis]|uniref:response regulator n=1 Tax=Thermanaerothrix daxensis TaxID=869279 RepID=UPI0006C8E877|nr:response regulator [Thermanaerothrix daxensis]
MNETAEFSSASRRPVVILAERDALVRDLLATALKRLNLKVVTAAEGDEALTLCYQQPPDLLITDIWLPHLNGLDLIRRLKQEDRLIHTQVIIITSLGFPEVVAEAAALGVQDFLIKPVDTEELLARVQRRLG